MKKFIAIIMALALSASSLIAAATAENMHSDIKIFVDGEPIQKSDVSPFIEDGRTLIPVRAVAENMTDTEILWDESTKTVTIKKLNEKVSYKGNEYKNCTTHASLVIGENTIRIGLIDEYGSSVYYTKRQMDTSAKIVQSRTFIPARFIGYALGYEVLWDAKDKQIDYNYTSTQTLNFGLSGTESELDSDETNFFNPKTITKNFYVDNSGAGRPVEGYNMTDYIHVYNHHILLFGGDGIQLQPQRNIGAYLLYDENKNFMGRVSEPYGIGYIIPENVHYIRIQYHIGNLIMTDGRYHHLNQINLDSWTSYSYEATPGKYESGTLVAFGDGHVTKGSWQSAVNKFLGVKKYTNSGITASTVALNEKSTQPALVEQERIDKVIKENPDILVIFGGTHDVLLDTPLGDIEELLKETQYKDKTTFYGAYGYLIETLLEQKPNLTIFLTTVPYGKSDASHPVKYSEISDAIISIANHYSLPVVDIYNHCGIDSSNLSKYSDDGIHYNKSGNELVADLMISVMLEHLFR